jgi:hypothetical protein
MCTLFTSTPIALIHFVIGAHDEVITPVPLLDQSLQHFYPNSGYIFLKVPFDVATHEKIDTYTCTQQARIAALTQHLGRTGHVFAFFSNHSEADSGWLFAGKVNGNFVAMSVSQVCMRIFSLFFANFII